MKLAASTISAIYRDRWEIEKFFRALKQCLRIKTFAGTTANAVRVQISTALIAILVLKYLQLRSQFPWSLSNLVPRLRQQLIWTALGHAGPREGIDERAAVSVSSPLALT